MPNTLLNFIVLASDTRWNEVAQQHFYWGLNEGIKDELACMEPLSILNNLIDLCIRTDDRLMDCHHECTLIFPEVVIYPAHDTPNAQVFPGIRALASQPGSPVPL